MKRTLAGLFAHALVGVALVSSVGVANAAPPAQAANARKAFPNAKLVVAPDHELSQALLGDLQPHSQPIEKLSPAAQEIARNVHLLMPEGADAYERATFTRTHVVLQHKDGVRHLLDYGQAGAQVRSGAALEKEKVRIGVGPAGRAIYAERGAGDETIRLYRQLPVQANGEVASAADFTSFALSLKDAYHPFGAQAHTVSITMPRNVIDSLSDNVALGGTGWGGGGGTGIDTVEEVQLDSAWLRKQVGQK